jgi:hypothetical protein
VTKKPIEAEPLNFTKYTSWGGAAGAAIIALYTPLKAIISGVDPTVALGLLLAGGLFFLAVALASVGDVLARAYATARTVADADSGKTVPATAALAAAIRKESEKPRQLSVPRIKGAKVQGKSVTILALELSPNGKTRFQVARRNEEPKWVDAVAVSLP